MLFSTFLEKKIQEYKNLKIEKQLFFINVFFVFYAISNIFISLEILKSAPSLILVKWEVVSPNSRSRKF